MTSRLSVYNGALRHLGERRLSDLSEAAPLRFELDQTYVDTVTGCLEKGYWNFAMRTVELNPDQDIETQFGRVNAFAKPEDWLKTFLISANETFNPPLTGDDYEDEGRWWYADVDPLYVRYVSGATDLGRNEGLWPRSFAEYVECKLAFTIGRVANNTPNEDLYKLGKRLLANARANDAMNEGVKFPPEGTWAQSKRGGSFTRQGSRWNGRGGDV